MSATLIFSRQLDFTKSALWTFPNYLDNQHIVLTVVDKNQSYLFNVGKVWLVPFLPALGDTRYGFQEICGGNNLIVAPGVSPSWKFLIQPYSKVQLLDIKVWTIPEAVYDVE